MIGIAFSVTFLALKLTGVIDWSWWWLAPAAVAAAGGIWRHHEHKSWRGF
jgi:hypothetical protein